MSMLTPPGMGGKKYRITGDRYPRMRRPRRRGRLVAGAVAAVAGLGLLGFGTLQLIEVFSESDSGTPAHAQASEESCAHGPEAGAEAPESMPVELPEPDAITVHIYNATDRSGLAQRTADDLAERGFQIGEVDNASEELDGAVTASGLLLGSPAAEKSGALTLLGLHLAGADTGGDEDLPESEIDLVIGDDFEKLATPEDAEAGLAALADAAPAAPAPNC